MRILLRIITVGTVVELFGMLTAIALKGGGTTGNLPALAYLFAPSLVVSLIALWGARTGAFLLLTTSAFGVALPFYLQVTGALRDYDQSIRADQGPSNHPVAWLLLYAGVVAMALTAAYRTGSRVKGGA